MQMQQPARAIQVLERVLSQPNLNPGVAAAIGNAFAQLQQTDRANQVFDRLLGQSGLRPEDFAGKLILEVGCGAGRFTEVLVSFGGRIISFDYSGSIDASA